MKKTISLTARIARTVVIAVTLGITGGVGLFLYSDMQRSLRAETERLTSTASAFASVTSDGVAKADSRAILEALRGVRAIKDVVYTAALDGNGRTITEIGTGVHLLDRSAGLVDDLLSLLPAGHVSVSADVMNSGRKVGTIVMQAEIADIRTRYLTMIGLSSLFGAIMVLLTALIVRAQVMRLMNPLNALAAEFQDIGRATDLSRRLVKVNEDEVGVLVDAFNDMFNHIGRRDELLKRHRDTLEDTVLERTHELKLAKDEAESANAAKSDFLATMSHEIRTPMNGMLVMAEMLAAAPLAPKHLRYAEIISRSGKNLLHIINDILDLSKIESGKIELECLDYAIDEVVEDVACLFAERAREKGLTLAIDVAPTVPYRLLGDPTRLAQIIGNLVNNGLKFTETGGVTISVDFTGPDRSALAIAVRDTGIGMTPEQTGRLFQRFAQADNTISRKFGGTGLGLSISRQLVELMGGTIRVESVQGEGSSFIVNLPLGEAEPSVVSGPRAGFRVLLSDRDAVSAAAIRQVLGRRGIDVAVSDDGGRFDAILVKAGESVPVTMAGDAPVLMLRSFADTTGSNAQQGRIAGEIPLPLSRSVVETLCRGLDKGSDFSELASLSSNRATRVVGDLGHVRVLVVDDVAVNREVLSEALRTFNIVADLAEGGEDAVSMAGQVAYDVIFMDCSMPGMDGFEATRLIRAQEAAHGRKKSSIFALTGHVMNRDSGRWAEEGMDGYLAKPFTIEQLDKVFAGLGASSTPDMQDIGGPAAHQDEPDVPVLSQSSLSMFRMISASTGADMMGKVFGLFRANAGTALEAVSHALAGGDPNASKLVHALKSNCSSAGAERAANLCNTIETMLNEGQMPEPAMVERLRIAIADTLVAMDAEASSGQARAS